MRFNDFRMVHGPTHTNLILDVAVPYDYVVADSEEASYIWEKVRELDENFIVVIDVDKE